MGQPPPEIDAKTNRKLLRRSVSAICAHAGFDSKFLDKEILRILP